MSCDWTVGAADWSSSGEAAGGAGSVGPGPVETLPCD